MKCPNCGHIFDEVHRWVDEMSDAVAREATVAHGDDSPVREADVTVNTATADSDHVGTAEVGPRS
jgi:hypothetical protein